MGYCILGGFWSREYCFSAGLVREFFFAGFYTARTFLRELAIDYLRKY